MSSQLDEYNTSTFSDVFTTSANFVSGYKASELYDSTVTDTTLTKTYALLYAQYGNNPIQGYTTDLWKVRVYVKLFMYAATWQKRLALLTSIRNLTDAELQDGGVNIMNAALNPASAPSASSMSELSYIDRQNTSRQKKSKLQGYLQQWESMDDKITKEYVDQFKELFNPFAIPQNPVYFESEE